MESKGCQKNQRYKFRRYWESRFVHEDHYEWLVDFAEVEGLLLGCGVLSQKQVDSSFCSPKILVVGCGNSSFSKDLYNTEKMKLKEPLLQWKVMDMTDMKEFQNNSFDIVIDKAAMDALVTDEGDPWHPSETAKSSSSAMIQEVERILRPGGHFVQISFQQPHFRLKYLQIVEGKFEEFTVQNIDKGLGYFFYHSRKLMIK